MNREQIRGHLKDTAGRFQRKIGQLFGNESQEMQGVSRQLEGKTEKAAGEVSETMRKTADRMSEKSER
jgi:uncharacterized protein YjbJ (UPF0337 family)